VMVSLMAHPSAARRARGAADPLTGCRNRQVNRDAFSSGLNASFHYGMARAETKF
jgi:hypothetical protein